MSAPEEMSRDELIALVGAQAGRIAELVAANEVLAAKLAKVEYLLSRNSRNSSIPPSKDDDPGRAAPRPKPERGERSKRTRGKQPGSPGTNLAWTDTPNAQRDLFPQGRCACGQDLAGGLDLGVVDRYQQHEIPLVSVRVTQYDRHAVRCGCGKVHTADRPPGAARGGVVGYGPNLCALVVLMLVGQFLPALRCAQLLEALTGAVPSVGFVHGMLARTARLVAAPVARIRALIIRARAVSCDETPIRVGSRTPKPGRKKAEKYLLVASTDRYTHYLVGDRDLATFKAFVLPELTGSVVVHDRYHVYDCAELGELVHQLCCQHLLRDLEGAAQVYPDALWPPQIADTLRELIHQANLARQHHQDTIEPSVRDELISWFREGVKVGLSATTSHGNRPGERKTRLLLEALRDREADVLRFTADLSVPPTSNQAERDLRPAKIQQNISGRLTSEPRTQDRYTIRGYLSTATKHGHNMMTALRDAITGQPWMPPDPAPT